MAISKRLRYEILTRDNHTCRYCHAADTPLTIDHVTPTALGGTDDPSNLVAACKDCNAGKSSSNPDAATAAQVSDEQLRWAAAIKQAAHRALAEQEALIARLEPFYDYWYSLVPSYKAGNPYWELPNNWASTIAGLLAGGLPDAMVTEAMRMALTQRGVDDRFRYFLGVARNMVAKLHDEAKTILAEQSEPPTPPEEDVETIWWKKGFDDAFSLPLVPEFYIQARALSRVVDGENAWNRQVGV